MTIERRKLVALTLLTCLAVGSLSQTALHPVRALVWSDAAQVPANMCPYWIQLVPCVDIWPSSVSDPLGRLWLVWSGKLQGGNGTLGRQDIYFRLWNGTWGPKQQVTSDPNQDQAPNVFPLSNRTMMFLWSSNRTGQHELFYQLFQADVTNPYATTGELKLTENSLDDTAPSGVQDLNGRIWVAWVRGATDIFYKYFDGTSWSSDFPLPPASSPSRGERQPFVTQRKDGRIMIVWASNDTQDGYFDIFYSSTDGTIQTLPASGIPSAAWEARTRPFTDFLTNSNDDKPVIVEARDGTLWIFWQKYISLSNVLDIYSVSSTNNAATWTTPAPVSENAESEFNPAAIQMSDNRVWVFWNIVGLNNTELWYKTSNPILNVHDVGLTSLSSSSLFIKSGHSVNITVAAANYGDYMENTTLTVQLENPEGTTVVRTIPLSLNPGNVTIVKFAWNSAQPYWGFWGRYNLTATLQTAPGETLPNQGDNSLSAGLMRISPLGDVDFDGDVDIVDAATLAFAYGTSKGPPPSLLWNPDADIDHNGVIDIVDAAQLAFYYGDSV